MDTDPRSWIDWKAQAHHMRLRAEAALDQRDECKAEFSKHLEAWKANNAYHAAEIERLKKALKKITESGLTDLEMLDVANAALRGDDEPR